MNKQRFTSDLLLNGACTALFLIGSSAFAVDFKGDVSFQGQVFTDNASHSATQSTNSSVSLDIEMYQEFGGNNRSLTFRPYARLDQHDDQRSHTDIRELVYLQAADRWEFKIGIGQEFWGVAESRNIVDIINQIDQVENLSTNEKLGQPMINLTSINPWGDLSFYVLPGFRERSFPGDQGRPRLPVPVAENNAEYESGKEERHVDFALRYSTYINEWDLGISYFKGTSREPLLNFDPQTNSLIPYYYQFSQLGLDLQATLESWLLKLEVAYLEGNSITDHIKTVTGLEYSFYSVAETDLDVGIVAEYLWDERDLDNSVFQNDLLIGLRFALNDEQSTEALVGVISNLDGGGEVLTLEASRRLPNNFKFSAEATVWHASDNPLGPEDYLQLELGYFF